MRVIPNFIQVTVVIIFNIIILMIYAIRNRKHVTSWRMAHERVVHKRSIHIAQFACMQPVYPKHADSPNIVLNVLFITSAAITATVS